MKPPCQLLQHVLIRTVIKKAKVEELAGGRKGKEELIDQEPMTR